MVRNQGERSTQQEGSGNGPDFPIQSGPRGTSDKHQSSDEEEDAKISLVRSARKEHRCGSTEHQQEVDSDGNAPRPPAVRAPLRFGGHADSAARRRLRRTLQAPFMRVRM